VESFARPCLRWVGNKQKLVSSLIQKLPPEIGARPVCEPFMGTGAFTLAMGSRGELCRERHASDLNRSLMQGQRAIRDAAKELSEYLRTEIDSLNETRGDARVKLFKRLVSDYNASNSQSGSSWKEQGFRFVLLNKLAFNGIYRTNSAGDFNVPLGGNSDKSNNIMFDQDRFFGHSEALQGVRLRTQSYSASISEIMRSDKKWLVYLDPPYGNGAQGAGFVDYQQGSFRWKDQERLAKLSQNLVHSGHAVIISNGLGAKIDALYPDDVFSFGTWDRFSPVSAKTAGRGMVSEKLVYGLSRQPEEVKSC
jgi:DNA adenine methylase